MTPRIGTLHACDDCRRLMPCVHARGCDPNGEADGPDLCHVCYGIPDSDCDECEEWERAK